MSASEAKKEIGDRLRIAAKAATKNADKSYRPLCFATCCLAANPHIRIKGQVRYPGGGERM